VRIATGAARAILTFLDRCQSAGPIQVHITYEFTVDDFGEEFGFAYVSRFRTVAQLQRPEIERAGAPKQGSPFGSGLSGLG
jgi:hypothetical protein